MFKILFALAFLTSSFASYAQYSMDDSSMENKSQGTFPELRASGVNEQKWSAGVTSGINSPKGPATSSAEFGLIIGFQPIVPITAGIEANTTRLNDSNDVRQTNVLLRSVYNLGGDIPVLQSSFIGVGVGPVFIPNRVRWAGAPIIGFDIPLSSKSHDYLSLGLEAKYLFITNTDTPDLFASALALKYFF
ncbi:MAG: hypothetical protein H7281_01275 [Bacteriovorax sp.]|nr:hypothetical protein [Bacteriovorax sp.]